MTKRISYILLAILTSLALTSCIKDSLEESNYLYSSEEHSVLSRTLNISEEATDYAVELPDYMRNRGMADPDIHNGKALLGRVLFYDTRVSKNETVSCASCHHQELAFSDNKALSIGFEGATTKRNSLALAAVANFESSYGTSESFSRLGPSAGFFWDERAGSIVEQSKLTIEDDVEMGMSIHELADRLKTTDYYPILFDRAYGSDAITPGKITEALQEFLNSFVSVESRFDEGMARVGGHIHRVFPNFTEQENIGRQIYIDNCFQCHGDMTSTVIRFANNGLDLETIDGGVGDINGFSGLDAHFKVPFLRNIALSAPYMHDGRFATLEQVVEHYNSGVKNHYTLSEMLRDDITREPKQLHLTSADKAALVAFLNTFTDENFATTERFSDPFRR